MTLSAQPRPPDQDREQSPRACAPCARCEAEQQGLYVLPRSYRDAGGRFDVCVFCYLKITRSRPDPLLLLE